MKKGTIPLTDIIFHIFPGVAFSKETTDIEIWTIFVLLTDISGVESPVRAYEMISEELRAFGAL